MGVEREPRRGGSGETGSGRLPGKERAKEGTSGGPASSKRNTSGSATIGGTKSGTIYKKK